MLCSCGNTGSFRKQFGGALFPEQAKAETRLKWCHLLGVTSVGGAFCVSRQMVEWNKKEGFFAKIWTSQCVRMLFWWAMAGPSFLIADSGVYQLLVMASFCFCCLRKGGEWWATLWWLLGSPTFSICSHLVLLWRAACKRGHGPEIELARSWKLSYSVEGFNFNWKWKAKLGTTWRFQQSIGKKKGSGCCLLNPIIWENKTRVKTGEESEQLRICDQGLRSWV